MSSASNAPETTPSSRDVGLDDLEWPRLVAAVVAHCRGPRRHHSHLELAASLPAARQACEETREAMGLRAAGEPLPLDAIPEVAPHLLRLERMAPLDGPALRDVQRLLEVARGLRRHLGKRRARCPALWAACATDPSLDALRDLLAEHLEPDGRLSDRASPTLRALRGEVSALRQRIVGRLETILQKQAELLSDRFYTQRDGRYVVPVRTDAPRRFPGIVHGTSSSGATVFVEPQAIVGLGNALKVAEGRLQREEARLLAVLSDRVRERLAEVRAAAQAVDHADLRDAMARFGERIDGRLPELVEQDVLELARAAHPLLLLDAEGTGRAVVPNDLRLRGGEALVVSGPNAGGKTVALETAGLAALCVRAGVPFPCAEGSRVGFFGAVLADVGDHQSTERNLSTFSAHVRRLAAIVEHAGPGTLVLLDELAASTDPVEGAALAGAVLERLCERRAAVAVTTHYEALKLAAERRERWRNASVGFDVEGMRPTFQLRDGVPGSSAALAVARRFGLPADVVERAESLRGTDSAHFERVVEQLQRRADELDAERAALATARAQLEAQRSRLAQRRTELEAEMQRAAQRAVDEAERLAAELRVQVREVERLLRERRPPTKAVARAVRLASEASERLSRVQGTEGPVAGAGPTGVAALEVGAEVWVEPLRSVATVRKLGEDGRVQVVAGPMRMWVDRGDLHAVRGAPRGRASTPGRGAAASGGNGASAGGALERTVDVRGQRLAEALEQVVRAVDEALAEGADRVVVQHGLGTGALRDGLRARLPQALPYSHRLRPGVRDEGGDGVTVVELG